MNILHINLNYHKSLLYNHLSKHLIKNRCNIKVISPTIKGTENFSPPYFVDNISMLEKYDRYFFNKRNKKIVKYIEENYNLKDFDLFHAHSLFSNGMIAYTIKEKYGIPYIVAFRNTDINYFFKKRIFLRKKGIKILKNAEAIISLSQPYKKQLLNKYIPNSSYKEIMKKIKVIPNGIEEFWHRNKNCNTSDNPSEKIQIIFVGDISKEKNVLTSAKACKYLIDNKNLKIDFLVVGKIKDKSQFRKLMRYNFIKYKPYQTKESLLNLYRNSDVFLMPSLRETFGLVYAEAMSQGLPIIYSRNQGFDQQFEDGIVGYSVNSRDPIDIANKIKLVLKNQKILSENCINLVDKFSWDKISKEYIHIYEEISKRY